MKKGKHLNELDKHVLEFIIKYKMEHCGDSPTMREIGSAVGVSSTSHITFILEKLEDFELIKLNRDENGRMKGIAVTGMVVVLCDSSLCRVGGDPK